MTIIFMPLAFSITDGIGLGFLATGLHQPLFHPLFVAPFLDLLRREKRWKELAAYVICYGAIGLFWAKYPGWVSAMAGHPVPAALNIDGISYIDRLTRNATRFTDVSLWIMGANVLRFVAWQRRARLARWLRSGGGR